MDADDDASGDFRGAQSQRLPRPRSVKDELRENLIDAPPRAARTRFPASTATTAPSFRRSTNAILVAPRHHPARPPRPGEDAPSALSSSTCSTPRFRRSTEASSTRIRTRRSRSTAQRLVAERGDADADRMDPPRGALPRKARDARRDDRRPDRRHRPDQGRDRRGGRTRTRRSSTSASFRARTAGSSRSTSCPISSPASRSAS